MESNPKDLKCSIIILWEAGEEDGVLWSRQFINEAFAFDPGTFSEITLIHTEPYAGSNRAQKQNKYVQQAAGNETDWILFLEAGDILHPKAFKWITPYIDEYDALWGLLYTYRANPDGTLAAEKENQQIAGTTNHKDILLMEPPSAFHLNHFVKASVCMDHPFDERIQTAGDYEYFLRIWHCRRCVKINRPICFKRKENLHVEQHCSRKKLWTAEAEKILKDFKEGLIQTGSHRNGRQMDLVIFGMRRSGTTLLYDLLTVENQSLVLYEPEILQKPLKGPQAAWNMKRLLLQLQEAGFDVSQIPPWNPKTHPTYLQYFDEVIQPLLSSLALWGVKMIDFRDWKGFLAAHQPRKLILTVRDVRDVVLSMYDLALRLNRQVVDEAWIQETVETSCRELVRISR
ncbi:MAG: sulfotransferase domain-containing protein, partial [Deltaproteobacteria bacterium]|nr:sulfotransferase domain-containing protein [Deltaproteobacteria bacterium]